MQVKSGRAGRTECWKQLHDIEFFPLTLLTKAAVDFFFSLAQEAFVRNGTSRLPLPLGDLSPWTGAISALGIERAGETDTLVSLLGLRAQVEPLSSKVTAGNPDPGGCA